MVGSRSFFRQHAFLLAASALPLLVVVFFVLASAIPRLTVPAPAYDLVLRAEGRYNRAGPRVTVDYTVRDGRVHATVRPASPNTFPAPAALFLFDHTTLNVREVPVDLPELREGDEPSTLVVQALADRRVDGQAMAPDGYALEMRGRRGPGLVGELFGMGRYGPAASLVHGSRVVPIRLPPDHQYSYDVQPVGWLIDTR